MADLRYVFLKATDFKAGPVCVRWGGTEEGPMIGLLGPYVCSYSWWLVSRSARCLPYEHLPSLTRLIASSHSLSRTPSFCHLSCTFVISTLFPSVSCGVQCSLSHSYNLVHIFTQLIHVIHGCVLNDENFIIITLRIDVSIDSLLLGDIWIQSFISGFIEMVNLSFLIHTYS